MIWGKCTRPGCTFEGMLHVAFTGWQLCDICFSRKVKWMEDKIEHRPTYMEVEVLTDMVIDDVQALRAENRELKERVALLEKLVGAAAPRQPVASMLRELYAQNPNITVNEGRAATGASWQTVYHALLRIKRETGQ